MKRIIKYQKALIRLSAWLMVLSAFTIVSCSDDDDNVAAVSADFAVSSQAVLESTESVPFTLTLSAAAAQNGKLTFSLEPGGAVYGTDFITKPAATDNTITVPVTKGQTAVQFTFYPINNTALNGDRTLKVTLSKADAGFVIGEKKTLDVTLVDDEGPSKVNYVVGEGRLIQADEEGIEVSIAFSSATLVSSTLQVSIGNSSEVYGTSFITSPEAVNNVITLPVAAGATEASFTVLPVAIGSIADIVFTLSKAEGGLELGTLTTYTLTVDPAAVSLSVSPTSALSFGNVAKGGESTVQSYAVSGSNLTEDVTVTAPSHYKVSLTENGTYGSSVPVPFASVNSGPVTVYVKFTPASGVNQTITGVITHATEGSPTVNVDVTGNETGNPLLVDNFDYGTATGTDIGVASAGKWLKHSGTQLPAYVPTGLSYTDYPGSGTGGSMTFTSGSSGVNDADVHENFPTVTTTSDIYIAFLLNVSSAKATADYFLHLGPNAGETNFGSAFKGRVYTKSNAGNTAWNIGVAKSSTTGDQVIDTKDLQYNHTYLVVLKYAFSTATDADDQISLFVYDGGIPATEATTPFTSLGPVGSGVTGDIAIGSVAIRQGTNTPTAAIDGLRVALTWAQLFE